MTTVKTIISTMLLIFCVSAAAEFTTIELAYEISLSEFQMPASENGKLSFKQCAECKTQTVRVTSETQYVLNREDLEMTEFRKSLSKVRDRSVPTVIVKHHLESDTIVSVSVSL